MPGDHAPDSRTLEIDDAVASGSQRDPAPQLFVVLESSRLGAGGARYSLEGISEIVVGRGRRRALEAGETGDKSRVLCLPDRLVSSRHARLSVEGRRLWFEDLGSRNGSRVDDKVARGRVALQHGAILEIGGTFLIVHTEGKASSAVSPPSLDTSTETAAPLGMTTLLPGYAATLADLAQIAIVNVPVLILGETGTGKELLARAVHRLSGRTGTFVAVNCGALPETLVESSLFGYEKGAFSGAAKDEPGLVRSSHRGTLFLDEIGDLKKASQAALLRVLQEREVVAVGGTKPVSVDLRVVAATHQRIEARGLEPFRGDLYARLAGFTLHVPPLRQRLEDLGVMIAGILRASGDASSSELRITPSLARAMLGYEWPYNARELQQLLSVGMALSARGPLDLEQAPEPLRSSLASRPRAAGIPSLVDADSVALRNELVTRLTESEGNISKVSRDMGKTRMQIHRWMKRFAINPESFRQG